MMLRGYQENNDLGKKDHGAKKEELRKKIIGSKCKANF